MRNCCCYGKRKTTPNGVVASGIVFILLSWNSVPLAEVNALVGEVQMISSQVASSSDDAEESDVSGNVTTNNGDLDLTFSAGSTQSMGIRFLPAIPPGATIVNAYIQFTADEVKSRATSLIIQGQTSDNAATFTSAIGDISSRPTGTSVPWSPIPSWDNVGDAGAAQRTPDLSPIIQEIVDRPGWSGGNGLAIIVTGTGKRPAETFDADPAKAAVLHVEYSSGSSGNQPPVVNAGNNQTVILPGVAALDGLVADDGLPNPPAQVTVSWSKISGPGTVTFANSTSEDTTASFSQEGDYVLRLTADDSGAAPVSDDIAVTVTTGGGGNALEVPSEYPTIQSAINAAVTGDVVLVAPGVYLENLVLSGKTITLASHYYTTQNPDFIDQTVIDGINAGPGGNAIVVTASVGSETLIQGFTIRNAHDGVNAEGFFNFFNNHVTNTADAIDFENGSGGVVKDCVFDFNLDDAIDLDFAVNVTIENNQINDNSDDGIEIALSSYQGPMLQIIIRGNTFARNGEDGIQLIDNVDNSLTNRVFHIERNLFLDNKDAGLGLMCCGLTGEDLQGASVLERIHLVNNTFDGNDHGVTGGDNLFAINNIFMNSDGIALKNVDGSSMAAYNLFFNNGTDFQNTNIDMTTTVFSDPLLSTGHRPQAGSPAIDAGTALFQVGSEVIVDIPPEDFNGVAPDLGAFES